MQQLFHSSFIPIAENGDGTPIATGSIDFATGDFKETGNLDQLFKFLANQTRMQRPLHFGIPVHYFPKHFETDELISIVEEYAVPTAA